MQPLFVYLHFPFCLSKCAYCDFNSGVAGLPVRQRYLQALLAALEQAAPAYADRPLQTLYLGGGTPTLYAPEELGAVLHQVRRCFTLLPDAEVTVEANPGTVTPEGLALLHELGANRLSLGVQSLDAEELRLLGRCHDAAEAAQAVAAARAAGFERLSLDLINALPGQTVPRWTATLEQVLRWQPEHLSCYGLSVPEGTALAARVASGELCLPDEETATALYETTHELCTAAGYEHYEIANYARPGYRCTHSLNYWANGEYLGLGAGAWSYLAGRRFRVQPQAEAWTEEVLGGAGVTVTESETLSPHARAAETLMLALRTADGVDLAGFTAQFGLPAALLDRERSALLQAGLALDLPGRLVLDPVRGFLLQSEIAGRLMSLVSS